MKFARFASYFALLLLLSTTARSQEDFIDGENPQVAPPTNGLFEDELEPLNDREIVRPEPPQAEANRPPQPEVNRTPQPSTPQNSGLNFPEPKKVSTPKSSGKSLPTLPKDTPNKNEKVRLDFVQVEIEDVVKYFAERLHKKFIYDPTILTGKVTIISPTEVTMQEAYGAFLSAMEVRGYVMYPAGAYFKIEKAANARKVPLPVYEGSTPNDDSFVTRILTLKYLLVRDISQAVRNLLSRTGGDLIEHAPTNTLIISDYAYNIRRIVRILDVLDVESFQEQIEIIQLKNAAAPDIARKVMEFFPSTTPGSTGGITPNAPRLSRRGGGAEGDSGVIQKVVADERTNSIIILGSERGIEQVKKFVARIDTPAEGGGGQIHVYPIQNVKAEEIAQTLSSLTSGTKSKILGPALIPTPAPGMGGFPSRTDPEVANLGEVKITSDKATNALVIQSSPRDFEVLKTIIRKLDIRRRQVFIEGAILEASTRKGSDWGISGAGPMARPDILKGKGKDSAGNSTTINSGVVGSLNGFGLDGLLKSALTNPAALTGMALGFRSGGTYPVNYTDANGATQTMQLPLISAIIKLVATNEDMNILSTPHILATANEDASLSIGQEIPQMASEIQTSSGLSQTSVTRLKVATELSITPQINQGDYLTLKIKERINDAGTPDTKGNLTTINREATTTVIVKDQQTVVIGGLMRDKKGSVVTKVPLLGDIPILGWLFKSRTATNEKVNLLLFLTPYIIKDTADMNDQFFRKLKEREGFLKEIGVAEKQGIPSLGLTEEQIQMLDKEYVKSLQKTFTYPRKASETSEIKNENPTAEVSPIKPAPLEPKMEAKPEPIKDLMPPQPSPVVDIPPPLPAPPLASPEVLPVVPPIHSESPMPAMPMPSSLPPKTEVSPMKEDSKTKGNSSNALMLEDSPPEKPAH
jgi:general secretion pathway protein D